MADDWGNRFFEALKESKKGDVSNSASLSCSTAEYNFSKDYPCMYEGTIACRECPRDECDMAAGRKLHQEYYVAGWLKAGKQ